MGGLSFFECKARPGDSGVWKGILSSRDFIRKGSCFKLGHGWSINPWSDPWIPWMEGRSPKPKDGANLEGTNRVANLLNLHDFSWNMYKLQSLFEDPIIEEICKIEINPGFREDKLLWVDADSGDFSTRSAYNLLVQDSHGMLVSGIWKKLWQSNLHERIKIFL